MKNNFPGDPQELWQNQQTEGQSITIQDLKAMLRQRHRRDRLRHWIFGVTFSIYLAVAMAAKIVSPDRTVLHTGWMGVVMFVLLIIWVLCFRYYVADRPMSLNLNRGLANGLEFYRGELHVQLEYFRNRSRWLPGLLLVVAVFVVTVASDPTLVIPLGILFAIFAGVWYRQWRRDMPTLRAEIEALESFRKNAFQ